MCIRTDRENEVEREIRLGRRSTTKDLRNRPGESRLGERQASDWLSRDLPEVPEAIQDPPLLAALHYNFHDTHEAREPVSLSLSLSLSFFLSFFFSRDLTARPLRHSVVASRIADPPYVRFGDF